MTAGRLALRRAVAQEGVRGIAARLGVPPSTVSRWCSGARPPSRLAKLAIVAELGITVDDWERGAFDDAGQLLPQATPRRARCSA